MGFRIGLDAAEKTEVACFSQESKFDVSVFSNYKNTAILASQETIYDLKIIER
jgi:hypothetical protein